ncbi:MAG: hypothetical protein WBW44_10865 [Solirubrobacterales bacterium]
MPRLVSWKSPDLKLLGYTVGQAPNPPLIVALVGAVLSRFLDQGTFAFGVSRAAFYSGLVVWAWLELTDGVNRFRQGLGAAGLVFAIWSMADKLS